MIVNQNAIAIRALPRMERLDGYPESLVRARLTDLSMDALFGLGWLRRIDGFVEISPKGWLAVDGRRRAALFLLRHPPSRA